MVSHLFQDCNFTQQVLGDLGVVNSTNNRGSNWKNGIIAWNKEGLVMASCTYPWENISDPIMVKVKACLQAVTMAEEMGF
ncbi:hypothetical protein Gogos_004643 [Gossypium gossypioides]|uniref:RNase H type-1 domain-containing protein n=1 Tax=Gossypium gossypioides TaxID=34282 RepID=A0A7J9CH58_GOSGO|nr:hypothetical protein [Gossypium gossypioides]